MKTILAGNKNLDKYIALGVDGSRDVTIKGRGWKLILSKGMILKMIGAKTYVWTDKIWLDLTEGFE